MRAVVQRVSQATLSIGEKVHSRIAQGLVILLGVHEDDTEEDVAYLCNKVCRLRIFSDPEGKMNLDLLQVSGELLIVSQFTLHASTKKGNRPSFITAARPEKSIPLYELFISECGLITSKAPATGVFGADMQVELVNDGPVTIIIDSKNKE